MSLNVKLLKDRILVKVEDVTETRTVSGLYIPESAQTSQRQTRGVVEAVGPGKNDEPMTVKVKDIIEFESYSGKMTIDEISYYIVKESSVIAIL